MDMREVSASIIDNEGNVITGYFYATTDIEEVLYAAREMAYEDGIDDWYKIIVTDYEADVTDDETHLGNMDASGNITIYDDAQ